MKILTFCISLTILGLTGGSRAGEPIELKVMSFNVRWDGLDEGRNAWTNRRPLAIEVIRLAGSDVVGLQEPSREQTADLVAGLETHLSFTGEHERDQHVPILYRSDRFKLESGGSFWLVKESELSGGTRRCTWVHLVEKQTGAGFHVFNVHLDHRSESSRQQSALALVRGIRERKSPDSYVVTGDFNEGPKGLALGLLLKPVEGELAGGQLNGALVDAFAAVKSDQLELGTGHGFTGRTRGTRIDFILVSKRDTVVEAAIRHDSRGDLFPSDHFPVTATIRLAQP